MSSATETLEGERLPSAAASKQSSRRIRLDRLAARIVTGGGLAIIASILAIFVVIAAEVFPLFRPPTAQALPAVRTDVSSPIALGTDEYTEIAYLVTESGVHFRSLADGSPVAVPPVDLGGAKVVAVSSLDRTPFALALSDGRVLPIEVRFAISYSDDGQRQLTPELTTLDPITVETDGRPIGRLTFAQTESGPIAVAAVGDRDLVIVGTKKKRSLVGPERAEEFRNTLTIPVDAQITALVMDDRSEDLFVGLSTGQLLRVDMRDLDAPRLAGTAPATGGSTIAVSSLGFLLGDRTLIVGDSSGGVSSWQLVRTNGDEPMRKIYDFASHQNRVIDLAYSHRDKGFVTANPTGSVFLHYGTTGATLLKLQSEGQDVRAVTLTPRADGIVLVDGSGQIFRWTVHNPHPEVTLKSLFGKVWYEGYSEPAHVWQSTGGTDDFESKLSLTPLVYGTLKGTFYALVIAIPLAVLGALYASQFMHPTLKGWIKPIVEIMAALPSVVLGFIAGLWLAPKVEPVVPGILLMPLVIPVLIVAALVLWRIMPNQVRSRVRAGTEMILIVPVVLAGGWLSIQMGYALESTLLSGDYRSWLLSALGLTYDQRNSLVVGFAMGFAVIPIIFTIAEDSLSNVPQHLTAGSLALGATRWQTALHVVLPTGSPGIFSAIMIGFGRAAGETMIVLMATGNTPVMNWSMFSGFRALSANIATELPEAPAGGTLYRVLFLAALLLFLLTFLVNTVAELVRLRLRKKYRYL